MKKVYTKPELEILVLDNNDIIVMSRPQFGEAVLPGDNKQDWNVL